MKRRIHIPLLTLLTAVGLLASCRKDDVPAAPADGLTEVTLRLGANDAFTLNGTRAFTNPVTNRVNRVLIVPFAKALESLPDDATYYTADITHAVQVDIPGESFPDEGIEVTIALEAGKTHQIMALGYNRADYDFNDPSNPGETFVIDTTVYSRGLSVFKMGPLDPTNVPEFFSCMCTVNGTDPLFPPTGEDRTLVGQLTRLYSGLSIEITDVPSYVESIALVSGTPSQTGNLVAQTVFYNYQVGGWTSGIVTLDTKTPDATDAILFEHRLLPRPGGYTQNALTLEVTHSGSASPTRYTVKPQNNSYGSLFALNPNEAINLTGDYETVIRTGFIAGDGLDLDDNAWDGI